MNYKKIISVFSQESRVKAIEHAQEIDAQLKGLADRFRGDIDKLTRLGHVYSFMRLLKDVETLVGIKGHIRASSDGYKAIEHLLRVLVEEKKDYLLVAWIGNELLKSSELDDRQLPLLNYIRNLFIQNMDTQGLKYLTTNALLNGHDTWVRRLVTDLMSGRIKGEGIESYVSSWLRDVRDWLASDKFTVVEEAVDEEALEAIAAADAEEALATRAAIEQVRQLTIEGKFVGALYDKIVGLKGTQEFSFFDPCFIEEYVKEIRPEPHQVGPPILEATGSIRKSSIGPISLRLMREKYFDVVCNIGCFARYMKKDELAIEMARTLASHGAVYAVKYMHQRHGVTPEGIDITYGRKAREPRPCKDRRVFPVLKPLPDPEFDPLFMLDGRSQITAHSSAAAV